MAVPKKPSAKRVAPTKKPATRTPGAAAPTKAAATKASTKAKMPVDPIAALFVRIGTGKKAPEARMELRALPPEEVAPRAIAAFADPRPKVRGNAYEFATTPKLRPLIGVDKILPGLSDPDPGVRLSTVIALNRGEGIKNALAFQSHADVVMPALAALLDDPDPRVKSQATIVHGRYASG